MTAVDERPAAPARGRRRSDRVLLPEWLDAPMLESEEPVDGDLVDVASVRPGDYLFAFHESDGSASWLRVLNVNAQPGGHFVTYGRGAGVTMFFPADRQAWVLPVEDAVRLVDAVSDRVLRAWGEPESAMEAHLRSFESRADLIAGWKFDTPSLADAVTAWELMREADEANRTDVPPTVLAVSQ